MVFLFQVDTLDIVKVKAALSTSQCHNFQVNRLLRRVAVDEEEEVTTDLRPQMEKHFRTKSVYALPAQMYKPKSREVRNTTLGPTPGEGETRDQRKSSHSLVSLSPGIS